MTLSQQEGAAADIAGEGRAARYPVADLRAYLAGDWVIRRTLDDRRRGAQGHFEGRATFTPLERFRFDGSLRRPAPPPGHPQHTMALGGRVGVRAGST